MIAAPLTVLAVAPACAEEPKAGLQGVTDEELAGLIRRAIGTTDDAANSRFEARRRSREGAERAIAVLRSEGYYGYEVEAELSEQDEESEEAPRAVVRVTPGPRFRIADPNIVWLGDPPIPQVQSAGEVAMALRRRAPGRAEDILAAEGRIVAAIQQRGYADAEAGDREVIVDHADNSVRPTYRINAGPLVKLDGLVIDSAGRTDRRWLRGLAPWKPGTIYSPNALAELERRLRETGAYDSVAVALEPKESVTEEGYRPVRLTLVERPRRTIEIGAGFSTSEGAGLDVTFIRYNGWRRADTRTITVRLAEIQQRFDYRVALPHWREPRQTLTVTFSGYNELTDAYDQTGASLSADITQRTGPNAYATIGVSIDGGRVAEILKVGNVVIRGQDRNLVNLSLLGAFALDRSDDPLDPRNGWRVEARAEPTVTQGDAQLTYIKIQAQASAYFPFGEDERLVLAGRLKAGTIYGADASEVPAARRFFSGGGGSVRGYGYQGIGPRIGGTPIGGASVVEGSIEVRYDLTPRWGVAAFIDAGAVGTDLFPGGDDYGAGIGIGVRYNLGFGPIRADIAVPLDPRDDDAAFQIYISIGQAF